jgi:antagonist of KipI
MKIRITKPGLLSTVQDMGRHGYQHMAVPVSGAMDVVSARMANVCLGNDAN